MGEKEILKIIKNHYRFTDFYTKFEKIFGFLKDKIIKTFKNIEVYQFFKKDNRSLLFLINCEIINFDSTIYHYILENKKINQQIFFADKINVYDKMLIVKNDRVIHDGRIRK